MRKPLAVRHGNVAEQYVWNARSCFFSFAPQWISAGIIFVWTTATVTFPGASADGGKTAQLKDLKTY